MNKSIFFIGGAQRCGTTYLYSVLDQHPEICMAKPTAPEPKFFLNASEVAKGSQYYLDKYYRETPTTKILGEKSTSYIESKDAGARIKAMFPQAKMIFMLRNPVARAISNYFFSFSNGLEKRSLHQVFIEKLPVTGEYSTSVSPFKYIERSEYVRYIESYVSIFGRENVKLLVFEEMIASDAFVRETLDFIGADPAFKPVALNEKVNASEEVFEVDEYIITALTEYFRPHNKQLEEFLGISLDHWNSYSL